MKNKKMLLVKIGLVLFLLGTICFVPVTADPLNGDIFETKMIADKAVYSAGESITYKIWLEETSGNNWYDIFTGSFVIDPNVESITINMPDYCSINGNQIFCEAVGGTPTETGLWKGSNFNGWLWVVNLDGSTGGIFTISGKIKAGTPDGTIVRSTAYFISEYENGDPGPTDKSESVVTVAHNAPEFPSLFLPVTFIIGVLGAVFLIQRTREY